MWREREILVYSSVLLPCTLNIYQRCIFLGLPEYGIPPCEPLMIPTLTIEQTAGPISITSTYTGVSVRGPASMRITNVE